MGAEDDLIRVLRYVEHPFYIGSLTRRCLSVNSEDDFDRVDDQLIDRHDREQQRKKRGDRYKKKQKYVVEADGH